MDCSTPLGHAYELVLDEYTDEEDGAPMWGVLCHRCGARVWGTIVRPRIDARPSSIFEQADAVAHLFEQADE